MCVICDLGCQPNCVDSICLQEDGACIKCADGFYGPECLQSKVAFTVNNVSLDRSNICMGHCFVPYWLVLL